MPAPPILILADVPDPRRLLIGDGNRRETRIEGEARVEGEARIEGDPPLRGLCWSDLDQGLSDLPAPSAIVCELGEALRSRAPLIAILRRAWPDVPMLSFVPAGGAPSAGPGLTREFQERPGPGGFTGFADWGLPIAAPISAENLRMLVHREARLLTLARRHRAAVAQLRDQSGKLDLLVDTVRSAGTQRDPAEVSALLVGRLADLVGADSWRLALLREEGEGGQTETLLGGRGRPVETYSGSNDEAVASASGRMREPGLPIEGLRAAGTLLAVPLSSRGRAIGFVELFTAGDDPDARFGARELELARALAEPLAILVDNALEFRRLEEQSVTDELTGLANSRFLKSSLGREIKRARRYSHPLSVIFIDLDGFKTVNDAHGHLAGSRMLAELGRVLAESMRETDIVARYGGDEFTIVMPHTGPEDARLISGRLQQRIEERLFLEADGLAARITASFGIACFPEHGETGEELIAAADRAMYRVKERGKNGVEMADSPAAVHCT